MMGTGDWGYTIDLQRQKEVHLDVGRLIILEGVHNDNMGNDLGGGTPILGHGLEVLR